MGDEAVRFAAVLRQKSLERAMCANRMGEYPVYGGGFFVSWGWREKPVIFQ
jgi:hypothetical protein